MGWELWTTAILALGGWFWWDGLRTREIAIQVARAGCQRAGVQLLDETVSLARLRLGRDENQRACFQRRYAFEFSDSGDNRLPGRVELLGTRVLAVDIVLPAAPEKVVVGTVINFPPHKP